MKRTVIRALVLAVVAGQTVAPAFAADNLNLLSSASGWRRQGDGAVMAYMHIPLGNDGRGEAQPRAGLALVTGRSYDRNEIPLHVNNPTIVDFGFTARSLTGTWAPTLNVGHTVAWTNNPDVLPPAQRLRFLDGIDWTWPVVGLATVAVGIYLVGQLD